MKNYPRTEPRRKRSLVWKMSSVEFLGLVLRSKTISEILIAFGLRNIGGNYKTIQARIKAEGVDASHIPLGRGSNRGIVRGGLPAIPIDEILVEHSTYNRGHLKKRLLKEGLVENECVVCGLGPKWNGKPLVLRLDHKNGVNDDNRFGNLRLVCPNCDSQLPTYTGRNKKLMPDGVGGNTAVFGTAEEGSSPSLAASAS